MTLRLEDLLARLGEPAFVEEDNPRSSFREWIVGDGHRVGYSFDEDDETDVFWVTRNEFGTVFSVTIVDLEHLDRLLTQYAPDRKP